MKVFIVTKEPFPNGMAATNRIACYAKGLIQAGIDCKVVIATRTERFSHKPNNITPKGDMYIYVGNKTQRASNVFIRRFYDFVDIVKTIKYLKKNTSHGDVILNYLREDLLNGLIIKTAKKSGAKVVRDLCEYPYGTGQESEKVEKKRINYFENKFPQFDGFICISQALFDLSMQFKSVNAKVIKIPIMVESEELSTDYSFSPIDNPYIFHSGTLYEQKDGILGAIEAFAIASKKLDFPIKYVLTGNLSKSPDKMKIQELIKRYNIKDKVVFTGFLQKEDLKAYQKGCTLMIINKLVNQQNTYCFATKLGEYLLSGKPVITTNTGEAFNYLEDGVSAYVIEAGNIQLLADKIVESFNNPIARKRIGINGRNIAINEFSYKKHGLRIAAFLKSL